MKLNKNKKVQAQSALIFAGLIVGAWTSPVHAFEYKETNGKAAVTDAEIAGGAYAGGKVAKFLGENAPAATTKVLQETKLGQPLTPDKIEEILAAVKKSPTSAWKLGDLGGGELRIVLDLNQYEQYIATQNANHLADEMRGTAARIAGIDETVNGRHNYQPGYTVSERTTGVRTFVDQVNTVSGSFKPKWGQIPEPINVAKSGMDGVRTQLEQIMASGARIQKISLHSLASRAILPGTLNGLGVASIVPSVAHLVSSLYHGAVWAKNKIMNENDAVCSPKSHCQEPGIIQKALISSAPIPKWVPHPAGMATDAR